MSLGSRLKEYRRIKKVTQEQLSNDLKINRSTYAKYETNENEPDLDTIQKLADYFSVSINDLVGKKPESNVYELSKQKTEFIIREIVKKYNLDLTEEGIKEKLEAIIKLVVDDYKRNN